VLYDRLVEHGRNREIEQVAAIHVVPVSQFGQPFSNLLVGTRIGVVATDVVEFLDECCRRVCRYIGGVLVESGTHRLAELLVGVLGPPAAQEAESVAEQSPLLNLEETRDQLSAHEVAGGAKDDYRRRWRGRLGADHIQGGK